MTLYCYVENGQITVGPCNLPVNWKNICNLNTLPDPMLIGLGWLPCTGEAQPQVDARYQAVTVTYDIQSDQVAISYTIVDLDLTAVKTAAVARLKTRTRQAILAEAPDYQQINAALGILSEGEKAAVVASINTHRESCNSTEASILSATGVLEIKALMGD